MICSIPVRSAARLQVSLRLPNWRGMPWTLLIDPEYGRPDMEPESPWTVLKPGQVVRFGFDRVVFYEVEAIVQVQTVQTPGEQAPTLRFLPEMALPR